MRAALIVPAAFALFACDKPPATPGAAAPPAAASSSAGSQTAATYRDAFTRLGKETNLLIGSVMFRSQGAVFDPTAGGTIEQAFAALKEKQGVIADLIKAARQAECDFALPRGVGEGPGSQDVMDFCVKLRIAARLLNADAARLWTEGDTGSALDRIEAMYGMSAHAADEQIALVALTVCAVELLANESVRLMAAGAAGKSLSGEQRERLLKAIGRLHSADPSGIVRARQAEQLTDPALIQSLQQSETKIRQDLASVKAALRAQ